MWTPENPNEHVDFVIGMHWQNLLAEAPPLLKGIATKVGAKLRDDAFEIIHTSSSEDKPIRHDFGAQLDLNTKGLHAIVEPALVVAPDIVRLSLGRQKALLASELTLLYQLLFSPKGSGSVPGYADRLTRVCTRVLRLEDIWSRSGDIEPYRLGTSADIKAYLGPAAFYADFGFADFRAAIEQLLNEDSLSANAEEILYGIQDDPIASIAIRKTHRDAIYNGLRAQYEDRLDEVPANRRARDAALVAATCVALDIDRALW